MIAKRLALVVLLAMGVGACRDAFDTVPKNPAAAVFPQIGGVALELKFAEPLRVRADARGRLHSEVGADVGAIQALLDDFGIALQPLITVPQDKLQGMYDEARTLSPGQEPPDLLSWHRAILPAGTNMSLVIAALSARTEIAYAYPAPGIVPPPVTPDFSSRQDNYFGAAPTGTEAVYARSLPGGRGANVTVIDAEYDWNTSHEDLLVSATLITGDRNTTFGNDHGTAVLGELVGRDNGFGVIDGTPDSYVRLAGVMFSGVRNVANSVANSSAQLTVGDVILIEQQEDGPASGNTDYVPVEWVQSVFDAISAATSAGRIVVEPAGNGSQNLDDAIFQGKFNRSTRDSRAIIVGAGDFDNSRLPFSDYGSRVDVQGHGTTVTTTGYGDLYAPSANQSYTGAFSGTSSASPIVASAVAVLQGYQKYHGRGVLSPSGMSGFMKLTGSAQTGNTSQQIGPKPNLRAATQQLDAAAPLVAVSISGPSMMQPGATCHFYASASGGLAPIIYSWSFSQGSIVGYSPQNGVFFAAAEGSSGTTNLTVWGTDAQGVAKQTTKQVTISSLASSCS